MTMRHAGSVRTSRKTRSQDAPTQQSVGGDALTRASTGTLGSRGEPFGLDEVKASLEAPNFLLKIIPDVDCGPKVCELVRYYLEDLTVKGAWRGPAALELHQHALAPVADLPALEAVSGVHIVTDLTLGLGEVVYDYLTD